MKSGLLTASDLVDVTGYARGADQMRALKSEGYRPLPGRDGHPRITWEAIHARMAGMADESPSTDAANEGLLDWTALGGSRRA